MTPSRLRQISRQLYSEPQTFASSRPTVRPSDHFRAYTQLAMPKTVWVKWFAIGPVGYVNTGVYNPSSDSYLFKSA